MRLGGPMGDLTMTLILVDGGNRSRNVDVVDGVVGDVEMEVEE